MSQNTKTPNALSGITLAVVWSVICIAFLCLFTYQKKVLSERADQLEMELQKTRSEVRTDEVEKVVYKVPEKVEGKSTVYRMDKETLLIVIDERTFKQQVKK